MVINADVGYVFKTSQLTPGAPVRHIVAVVGRPAAGKHGPRERVKLGVLLRVYGVLVRRATVRRREGTARGRVDDVVVRVGDAPSKVDFLCMWAAGVKQGCQGGGRCLRTVRWTSSSLVVVAPFCCTPPVMSAFAYS